MRYAELAWPVAAERPWRSNASTRRRLQSPTSVACPLRRYAAPVAFSQRAYVDYEEGRPLHIVVACDDDESYARAVTAHEASLADGSRDSAMGDADKPMFVWKRCGRWIHDGHG